MHVFFKKRISKSMFGTHLLCARSAVPLGPHSFHNTPRDCPEAFPGVYVHHRGWGAVNLRVIYLGEHLTFYHI